jgi:hypothetical protein
MQNVHYFREINFLSVRKRRWRTTSGLPLSLWHESASGAVVQIISFSYVVFLRRLVYSLFKMNSSTGTNFRRARKCAHFLVIHLFFFQCFCIFVLIRNMSIIFANFQFFGGTEASPAYHKRTAAVALAGVRPRRSGADHPPGDLLARVQAGLRAALHIGHRPT